MSMHRVIWSVFFGVGIAWFAACGVSKESIQQEIDKARVCAADEDCVNVGSKCPFGCYVVVNKKDAESIRSLLKDYKEVCAYDCMALDKITCKDKQCTAITK